MDSIPRRMILRLIYLGKQYWRKDRYHQGLRDLHRPEQWMHYLDRRIGILRRSGLLQDGQPLDILEIGCSEGMLLKALGELGHRAAGCEANRQVARLGQTELGVRIAPVMFEELPVAPRSQDLVVSYHTLEHLADPAAVLEKAALALRPGGGICIEVPTGPEEFTNIDHLHFFTRASLERLLARFFQEVELIDERYTTVNGETITSVYGIGRRPRAR